MEYSIPFTPKLLSHIWLVARDIVGHFNFFKMLDSHHVEFGLTKRSGSQSVVPENRVYYKDILTIHTHGERGIASL